MKFSMFIVYELEKRLKLRKMEVETYCHARFVVGLECNQLLLFSPETCVGILWMVWAYKNRM